ncbi:MAG: ABC transporter permease, partial [Enterococcus hirae]|nr:ABC transporter permease [Enterococcus hirae]
EYGVMYVAIVIMIVLVFILQMLGNFVAQTLDKRK